jgi:tetratricopeptide (TPR) repeat protein
MSVNENHIALIEKYLDGSLNKDEQSTFDRLKKESPEFFQTLEDARHTLAALKNNFNTNLKDELKEMYTETVTPEKVMKKRSISFYWAAAAVILGISVVWSYYSMKSSPTEDLFHSYYQIYPVMPAARGTEGENDQAIAYYQDSNFAHALPLLLTNRRQNPDDDLLPLYIGNCYLNLDNYQEAIATFKEGALSEDRIVRQTSRWYLALSYLAAAQTAESMTLLQNIVEGDELYANNAAALLKEDGFVK